MKTIHMLVTAACLLALSSPAMAAQLVTVTVDSSSPELVPTGVVFESGDRIIIQAEGAMRFLTNAPVSEGWYGPAGRSWQQRVGQVHEDCAYGVLLSTVSSSLAGGIVVGELMTRTVPSSWVGNELQLGLNMSASDRASAQGNFLVHVIRYSDEEAATASITLDSGSPIPAPTGITATDTDQKFFVVSQGAARISSGRPLTDGWFGPTGLGSLRRSGQLYPDTQFGAVLGTFNSTLAGSFYLGDVADWFTQPAYLGSEFKVGLNMSASDMANLQGRILVHVMRIDGVVTTAVDQDDLPARDAVVGVDNYPNPFNPMTTVRFELARQQRVRLMVVDVAGNAVRTLREGTFSAGRHEVAWDGRDDAGRGQPSGTYLLRLVTDDAAASHKLTLVR